MTLLTALAIGLHQLAALIWVGGMFFAHMALRPAARDMLKGNDRLLLMWRVFRGFFPWVWTSVVVLWVTGLWIFKVMSAGKVGMHVHAMMGTALVMTGIFVYLYVVPYRKLTGYLAVEEWNRAGAKLGVIRRLILVNLLLGIVTVLLGSIGNLIFTPR